MAHVLCAADSASMKFYFNEDEFGMLPREVKQELRIALVSYCADVGGTIALSFNDEGSLIIEVADPIDEIGSELLVKRMRKRCGELFVKLEEFGRERKKL